MKQALGRVWRAKGAKSIQRIFFAAGTIEEAVCKGVNEKIGRIDILNDGLPDEVLRLRGEVDFKLEAEARLALTNVTPAATVTRRESNGATSVTFTPSPAEAKKAARREETDKLALRLTRDQIDRAHRAMQQLAGMDADRASTINAEGFGKFDVKYGHHLAYQNQLTPRQGAEAVRLARKYRRQVGDLFPEIYGNAK